MGTFRLCNSDPLVTTLTDVFRANIIRVPEARVQPLCVIASRDGRLAYCGRLVELLAGESISEIVAPTLETSQMAEVAGKSSRQINIKLGLDILNGFLGGFGVPVSAGIGEQFSGAAEVSFSFSEVQRIYIDPSKLGRHLAGRALNPGNPVAATFLQEEPWDCLLIDSVITSSNFSIKVDKKAKQDFHLDVPKIQQVLSKAKANIQVGSASSLGLTFRGPKALAFAFSCQQLIFDRKGRIVQMPPDTQRRAFGKTATEAHVLLSEHPAMLEWAE